MQRKMAWALKSWSLIRGSCLSTRVYKNVTRGDLPEYLFDRTVPAREVLNKLTAEDQKRLEFIKTEYEHYKSSPPVDRVLVPQLMNDDILLELLCFGSFSGRRRVYEFYAKKEFKIQNTKQKKAIKREEEAIAGYKTSLNPTSREAIIRVISESSVKLHNETILAADMRNPECSQSILFDFSHGHEMRVLDEKRLSRQIVSIYATNRNAREPFHLMLTNLQQKTNMYSILEATMLYSPMQALWSICPEHFSQLMKQRHAALADRPVYYLSPDSRQTFEEGEWDDRAVFVIGGLIDTSVKRPVTEFKAKEMGIPTRSLPIHRHVKVVSGSSTLTLLAVYRMLQDAKVTRGDWASAIRNNMPSRTLVLQDKRIKQITKQFRF